MNRFAMLTLLLIVAGLLAHDCGAFPSDMNHAADNGRSTVSSEPAVVTALKPAVPEKFAGLVNVHNQNRREFGLAPLTWSPDLAAYAQDWANRLKKQGCGMQHRSNMEYGENLAWSSAPMTGAEAATLWASERKDYDIRSNSCRPGKACGHWTQMVWADSRRIGCGVARCGDSEVWVCNYDPPGNYIGQKPY